MYTIIKKTHSRLVVCSLRRVVIWHGKSPKHLPLSGSLKKTYKRGGSTVIWKCSWGYKIAPQNKNISKLKIPRAQEVECTVHTPKSGLGIVLRQIFELCGADSYPHFHFADPALDLFSKLPSECTRPVDCFSPSQ